MEDRTVLEVNSLTAGYGSGEAIKKLTFSLKRGEILCLVGESGSGKSTVLKALMAAPEVKVLSGEIRVSGKALNDLSEKDRQVYCSDRMGMIFQSPGAAFNPIRTYQKQFIETLKSHGKYHGKTFREEVTAVFGKVGLQDADRILRQCPYALSGGMNQRVALALALLLHQEVLLCDEPTSALDATTALGVVKGLEKLREQGEVTQIIVTHNLAMAGALADRIGVMCEGELVELGEASEIVNSPKHPYTKRLMEAVPRLRRQPGTSYPELPVLETLHLTKDYRVGPSEIHVLKDGSIRLSGGEILGVVGESGSGKTTLLRIISGLEAPKDGVILLNGKELSMRRAKTDYGAMQMIFQEPVASFHPRRTIGASIRETVRSLLGKETIVDLKELAGLVGLPPEFMDRYPGQLSGGQCQRLAIARAMAVKPRILLCDEITSALDVSTQAQILELLAEVCKKSGMSAVFVSHDLAVVSSLCDRVVVMKNGEIVEEGDTCQVITAPKEEYTKDLIASVMEPTESWKSGERELVGPRDGEEKELAECRMLADRVRTYWTRRTKDFHTIRLNELHGEISDRWLEELRRWLPAHDPDRPLRILDAGTGTGYFAILLAREGHEVVGIDMTPSMLETAKQTAEQFGVSADFWLMDVQETSFESESFDVVVSRNVTWTLPDPGKAYEEWYRILKPGGILLNFDANYADNVRHENQKESYVRPEDVYGHIGMTGELIRENAEITLSMPASDHRRPAWDGELAEKTGFASWGADETLGRRILRENDMSDAPMFLFWAEK